MSYRLTIWYDDDTWHSFTDLSSSEMEFGLKTFRKIMRQFHARVKAITVHRYLTAHGTTHIKVEQSILRKETG